MKGGQKMWSGKRPVQCRPPPKRLEALFPLLKRARPSMEGPTAEPQNVLLALPLHFHPVLGKQGPESLSWIHCSN